MTRAQLTRVEVVLLNWQKMPDELLALCSDWMYTDSRFYRIAQADIGGELTIELLGLFEQLKENHLIADSCGRVVAARRPVLRTVPDTGEPVEAATSELPDWVRQ